MNNEQVHEKEDGVGRQVERRLQEPNLEPGASDGYQVYPGITLLEERDRQRQQMVSKLRDLSSEIKASEGYRIRNEINLLSKTYFIFDGNYLNLKHVLEEFEQPTVFLKLWDGGNRDKLDLYINEVVRYFHNYLAGAVTLLDHVRALVDGAHQGTSFAQECKQQMDAQFNSSPHARLMMDLRKYMLHHELPFALAEINFSREGGDMELESAIRLDVTKLRDWQGWSDKGQECLDALDNKVNLSSIVNEYAAVVAEFYRWVGLRQSELHREALRDLDKLEDQRVHLQQEMKRLDDLFEVTEKATSSLREEREMLVAELRKERELTDRLKTDLEKARRSWWRR